MTNDVDEFTKSVRNAGSHENDTQVAFWLWLSLWGWAAEVVVMLSIVVRLDD